MTPRRYELTDFEWSIIAPLLPNKPRGVPRADDRRVLNGIYWRLRTGSPWADIPERYGPPTTCYNRFVRWRKLGIWDRIFTAVSEAYDGDLQMVDASSIRVHQHAANVKRGATGRPGGPRCSPMHGALARRTDDEDPCAGRCQRQSNRTQTHRRPGPRWQKRRRLSRRVRRRSNSTRRAGLRTALSERGAWANVKPMPRRVNIPAFSPFRYRYRNLVERFFNKIKHFRAVATRFEKHDANDLAVVKLVAAPIWMQFISR